jgi:ribosomal protein S18 acetylase RimI-like enzyme
MLDGLLDGTRFLICWRAAMTLDLRRLAQVPRPPDGYRIVGWDPARVEDVSGVDYRAYRGTIDGALYWRYFCSPAGCRRMWEEALRGRFGTFDAERTRLLFHGDRLCGDVMCSNRGREEGFIGNVAVLPEDQGGTGRALLVSALCAYREAGFRRVSLAVTIRNTRAHNLYRELGFRQQYRFPVVARPGRACWPVRVEEPRLRGCPRP